MFFSAHIAQRKGDGKIGQTLGTLGWVYGEYQSFRNFMRYNAEYMQKDKVYLIECHASREAWRDDRVPFQTMVHVTGTEYDRDVFRDALDTFCR